MLRYVTLIVGHNNYIMTSLAPYIVLGAYQINVGPLSYPGVSLCLQIIQETLTCYWQCRFLQTGFIILEIVSRCTVFQNCV